LRLDAQKQAHTALLEKVQTAQNQVDQLKEETSRTSPQVADWIENINTWEGRTAELRLQIQDYESKIVAEKLKHDEFQQETTASTKEKIAEEARQGLKYLSPSEAIVEEIQFLISAETRSSTLS
jgi:peptidoglycan hydrolase CwlO-like protein